MNILQIKDLIYLISDHFNTKTLLLFSHCNKRLYSLINSYCSLRYYKKYSGISKFVKKDIDKKTFFENKRCIKKKDCKSVEFAISRDRLDLLCLIFHFNTNLVKRSFIYSCIVYDSPECFNYLEDDPNVYMNIIIKDKKIKILDKVKNKVLLTTWTACNSIKYDFPEFLNIFVNKQTINSDFFYKILTRLDEAFTKIEHYYEYNKSFAILINMIDNGELKKVQSKALANNRFDMIKLITLYTSRFSEYKN